MCADPAVKDGMDHAAMTGRPAATTAADLGPVAADPADPADPADLADRVDRADRVPAAPAGLPACAVRADFGTSVDRGATGRPATTNAAAPVSSAARARDRVGADETIVEVDALRDRTIARPLCRRRAGGWPWCCRSRRVSKT